MPFPRHRDNSLDFVTFETLDPNARQAALLELKANGTPVEHQQIRAYLIQDNAKIEEQKRQVGAHNDNLRSEIDVLQRQKAVIVSNISGNVQRNTNQKANPAPVGNDKACVIF